MLMAVFWLLVALLLARLFLTGEQRPRLPPEWASRTDAELARLREEVERLSTRVDRLVDEQSFLLRLLGEGERPRLPQPEGEEGAPGEDQAPPG